MKTTPLPSLGGRPDCPRGCASWAACDERDACSATGVLDVQKIPAGRDEYGRFTPSERVGFNVCVTGVCIEPCGPNGGCIR